jgi:hypothetical protein
MTNLLVAVDLARKWDDEPLAHIRLFLRQQSQSHTYRGTGSKAKRRMEGSR